MNILITGGKGFIGPYIVNTLAEMGNKVFVVDNRHDGTIIPHLKTEYLNAFAEHGCAYILATEKVDVIIHLAAWSTIRDALHQPAKLYQQNVQMTADILQAVEKAVNKPEKIIFASSSAVLEPRVSYYGASKFACEDMLRIFSKITNIQTHSIRFGNVYGPGQSPKNGVLIAKLTEYAYNTWRVANHKAEGDYPQFEIYGPGNNARYYIHARDIAYMVARTCYNTYMPEVFNASTPTSTTTKKVVQMGLEACEEVFDVKMLEPIHTPADPTDKDDVVLPMEEWADDLMYPQINIETIKGCMAWRKNAEHNVFHFQHDMSGRLVL